MHRFAPAVARLRCPHAEACFLRHWGRGTVDAGVDPGSKTGGVAIIRNGVLIWCAEIAYRSAQIRSALKTRAAGRSARRCRAKQASGRHRKESRFKHRTRPAGWLAPSVYHRVQSTLRWLRFALRYAGVGASRVRVHVEVCAFDAHAVLHPEVHGAGYQRGPLFEANLRGYVLRRDKAWCRYCGAKDVPLQMDHVVAKSRGGADGPWNRMPACAECNTEKGSQDLAAWVRSSARVSPHHGPRAVGRARRLAAGKVSLKHMAATNVVAPAIARACEAEGWEVVRTSGADTAAWRRTQGVGKSHANDALCTAAKANTVCHRSMRALHIRMTGRGRRLVRAVNKSGFPRLRKVPTTYDGRRAWAQVPCEWHRETPPCGLRAGDTVRIRKEGFGRRRRIGVATTVRHDGRCVVQVGRGEPFNIMASRLTLAHRGLGAHIR